MDNCYSPKICNCQRECTCDPGYECCSENPPHGKPQLGVCVKSGTCDRSRGLCKPSDRKILPNYTEKYTVFSKEGYSDDNCDEWNRAFWVLLIVIFILISLVVMLYVKK